MRLIPSHSRGIIWYSTWKYNNLQHTPAHFLPIAHHPSQLPLHHHLLCIVLWTSNRLWNFYLNFYAFLRLRFPDVETNPGLWCLVPAVCRILCSNVQSLQCTLWLWSLSGLTVAWSQYDILFGCETLVSYMRHVSELVVPWFGRPRLLRLARCLRPRD